MYKYKRSRHGQNHLVASHLVTGSKNVLLGLVTTAGAVQKLHQTLLGNVTLILSTEFGVVGLQAVEQHRLMKGHTSSSEDRGVIGHPGEEDETLADGSAGSLLVDTHHSENSIEHLAIAEMLHHLSHSVSSMTVNLKRLVLGELDENPVERRVLLLELLPQAVEGHLALLDISNVISLELDILGSDVKDIVDRGMRSAGTAELLDDLLLGHLLQSVDLKADMSSAEELTDAGANGTDLSTIENGSFGTNPRDEHVFHTSAGHSRLILDGDDLNEGKLALEHHVKRQIPTFLLSRCLMHSS